MARRIWSLHHNLKDGENIPFHREHRSKRGRSKTKIGRLQKYKKSTRHKWNNFAKSVDFLSQSDKKWGKQRKY